MSLSIDLLKNHPHCIPRLAEIWQEVLGSIWAPHVTLEQVHSKYQTHLNDCQLPITFVALVDRQPVGMCSLRENDGIRPELSPWLGSLVLDPVFQNQGIAKLLIEQVKTKAKQLGYSNLYLFAFDPTIPTYYNSIGWKTIADDQCREHPVTVMEIIL